MIVLIITLLVALSIGWVIWGGDLSNPGYLLLGGMLTVLATVLVEEMNRPLRIRTLARAIYVELASRVARCCFDFEAPWAAYLSDPDEADRAARTAYDVLKFSPAPPLVYSGSPDQLGLLDVKALHALGQFYYRLDAVQRDAKAISDEAADGRVLLPNEVRLFARRLHETLAPALLALDAMSGYLTRAEVAQIEAATIGAFDATRGGSQPTKTLRERLHSLTSR